MADAITKLKDVHKKVKELFKKLEQTSERAHATREVLLHKLAQTLQEHMEIEEKIFYPAFKKATGKRNEQIMYYEAQDEHNHAKMGLAQLQRTNPATELFAARIKVLREIIEHHVGEEEREIFPAARNAFSKSDLQSIGSSMDLHLEKIRADPQRATEPHTFSEYLSTGKV